MRALILRHTKRDIKTGEITDEGQKIAQQVIAPFGPFDAVFSAKAGHCTGTAQAALGDDVEIFADIPELDKFVAYHDELKTRASSEGRDHSEVWFQETDPNQALELIKKPGKKYKAGILLANFERGLEGCTVLFVLRGSGMEGLAKLLDPDYTPFGGWHFDRCEGFWVEVKDKEVRLLSYVRRR